MTDSNIEGLEASPSAEIGRGMLGEGEGQGLQDLGIRSWVRQLPWALKGGLKEGRRADMVINRPLRESCEKRGGVGLSVLQN